MCFRPADVGGGDQRDPSAGGGLPRPRGLLITVCGLEPPEDLQELARTPSASPVSFICLSRLLVHNIILQLATTGRTKPLIQRPLGLCSDTWLSELSKIICQPFLLLFSEHGQTKSDSAHHQLLWRAFHGVAVVIARTNKNCFVWFIQTKTICK